jgi:hypothetical protein
MKLEFTVKYSFGSELYYPANPVARALVDLAQRKCLKDVEVAKLRHAGFEIIAVDTARQKESDAC